jgi:putative membrane protein insertion efficiency factor
LHFLVRDKLSGKNQMRIFFICILVLLIISISRGIDNNNSDGLPIDTSYSTSQSADNLNLAIMAIKGWQKISFSTSLLDCPFEPCCSNYAIHAISHKGFFTGVLYTADRISRCHPFALQNYSEEDGSFVDEVDSKPYFKSEHVPYLTIPASLIMPGFNKVVNGRVADGMYMFMITGISAYGTYNAYRNGNEMYIPLGLIFLSFYMSDVYFNILSL